MRRGRTFGSAAALAAFAKDYLAAAPAEAHRVGVLERCREGRGEGAKERGGSCLGGRVFST